MTKATRIGWPFLYGQPGRLRESCRGVESRCRDDTPGSCCQDFSTQKSLSGYLQLSVQPHRENQTIYLPTDSERSQNSAGTLSKGANSTSSFSGGCLQMNRERYSRLFCGNPSEGFLWRPMHDLAAVLRRALRVTAGQPLAIDVRRALLLIPFER